ncbi:30S ribosomal protein S11 [Patescibacteria group bacterium]|nr:30S ribosomal protein S11 [Patescibacteria group bacterium]
MGKKRVIQKSGGEPTTTAPKSAAKSKSRKKVPEGRVYIFSSYNNTLMTLTDERGNALFQTSAGALGFKGTKKSTPFAAAKVTEALTQFAKDKGMERVQVYIKGVGSGRESALRSLGAKGIDILGINDVTPVAFNGPRPKKARRV